MELDQRSLGLHNLTARLDYDKSTGATVTIFLDEMEVWSHTTKDGAKAVSIYKHPFAHGFRLPEGARA